MSSDEFEKRINNKIETILETQANLQESIAGLVQVARLHNEQLDDIRQQIKANSEQIAQNQQAIAALAEHGKEQQGRIDALIRIVEGHLSDHS